MKCITYIVLIVFLALYSRPEFCTGVSETNFVVDQNMTFVDQTFNETIFKFLDLSQQQIPLASVDFNNCNFSSETVYFKDEGKTPTKTSTKFFITLNNVTIDKGSIEFNINFPPGSRVVMNNTNINVYQTTPISFVQCTLRDNVTVKILNTYSIGLDREHNNQIIEIYNQFIVDSLSAFIIQHMTSVNARALLTMGEVNISEQSVVALDDVNCYRCISHILSASNLNVINGSMLRLFKVVLMPENESYAPLVYANSFFNVINGSLFAMRDCLSYETIFEFYRENFTLINNSVLSLKRISATYTGLPWEKPLPAEADDKSFVYGQQIVLYKNEVTNLQTLWKYGLGVDAIVDESTGYMHNTDVCGYAECIPANSNFNGNSDMCSCQCREPNAYWPQCSLIDDSVQSIIDDQTLHTEQEHCAISDASNYKICRVCDKGYVPFVPFYEDCSELSDKGECKQPVVCVKSEKTDKAFIISLSYKTVSLLAIVFATTILAAL